MQNGETTVMSRQGDTLGYARVSTADQDLTTQKDRLEKAGAIRIFTDVMSGGKFDRPGLKELVDHARPGDRLCVTRLDRLGRSLKELLETAEDLKRRRIHLVSLEESIDTASAAGELVFHVFAALAHFERRLIVERTLEGVAAARRQGRHPGRPRHKEETVAALKTLVDAGMTPAQAAEQLGIGRSSAYRIARKLQAT